jgi:hypothetical protein
LIKMVAVGADGNVRGQMVLDQTGAAASNGLPGADQFLTYKGQGHAPEFVHVLPLAWRSKRLRLPGQHDGRYFV